MRPLRLEMTAFGSYAKETVIDFTKPSQNLFLITGNTGSGKSTIFDAIVFALYGEVGGNREKMDTMMMQSQFADRNTQPKVVFTFARENKEDAPVYEITRVPKHFRKSKRKSKNSKAYILENGFVELKLPDQEIVANRETQEKIEEIVGLTKQQFLQVAMIAQGEFMELLQAGTKEKVETFRKLFHTDVYRKITDKLRRKKEEKEKDLAKLNTYCSAEIAQVRYGQSECSLKCRELSETLGTNISMLEEYLICLEQMCSEDGEVLEDIQIQQKKSSKTLNRLKEQKSKAEALQKAYMQKETFTNNLKELEAKAGEMQKLQQKIAETKAAYAVKPLHDKCEEYRQRKEDYRTQKEEKTQMLPVIQQKRNREAEAVAGKRSQVETLKEEYNRLSVSVQKECEAWEQLKAVAQEADSVQKKLEVVRKELHRQQEMRKTHEEAYEQCLLQREKLQGSNLKLEKEQNEYERQQEKREEVRRFENAKKEYGQFVEEMKNAQKEFLSFQKEYETEESIYQNMNAKFLSNQAGILAKNLHENEACPVCGSKIHPKLKQLDEKEVPSEDMLNRKKYIVEQLEVKARNASQQAGQKRAVAKEKWQALSEQSKKLFSVAFPKEFVSEEGQQYEKSLCSFVCSLEEQLEKQKQMVEQLEKDARQEKMIEAKFQKLQQTLEEVRKNIQELEEHEKEYHVQLAKKQTQVKEKQSQCHYKSQKEAETALNKSITILEKEKNALALLEKSLQNHSEEEQTIKGEIVSLGQAVADFEEKRITAQHQFELALQEQKIGTFEEYHKRIKQWSKEELESQKKNYEDYRQTVRDKKQGIVHAEEIINGMACPDMEQLLEQLQQETDKLENITTKCDEIKSRLRNNRELLSSLQLKMQEREGTAKEYGKIRELYEVASGQVSGQNKMDLETYVQRYYLKQVLNAANARFVKMSGEQFELCLKEIEDSGNARNEGLDFMVHSLVTDSKRDIKSLSGGESFMAALSLALAMADQIQNASSGIHLDMMFIDEGFGSLDEEARNQAVSVLKELAGGKRLIGIISHVSELKSEIEDRLEVTKDESGSRVFWA